MPIYKIGDMLEEVKADRPTVRNNSILITTNSFLKKDGSLVMGAGFAKQVADQYPEVPALAGERIMSISGHLGTYGCMPIHGAAKFAMKTFRMFGLFQVKKHFKDNADLDLIRVSTASLLNAIEDTKEYDITWHLNYPGIGNGKLTKKEVEPILDDLPTSVVIWEKPIH